MRDIVNPMLMVFYQHQKLPVSLLGPLFRHCAVLCGGDTTGIKESHRSVELLFDEEDVGDERHLDKLIPLLFGATPASVESSFMSLWVLYVSWQFTIAISVLSAPPALSHNPRRQANFRPGLSFPKCMHEFFSLG